MSDHPRPLLQKVVLFLVIGALALGYAFYRAVEISFTHDESLSFLNYIHRSTASLFRLEDPYTNNHLLNSVGMKWSSRIFGSSEWALRMPNLILFAIHLFYCGAILLRRKPILAVPAFMIMAINITLLATFSVARGYGMSIGFMVMACYHFIGSIRGRSRVHIGWFHFALICATLSNFTQLDVYLAALILYYPLLFACSNGRAERWMAFRRTWWVHAILLLVAFAVLVTPVLQVIRWNAFDFGGKTGFIDTTVRSVIYMITPGRGINENELLYWQVGLVLIVATSAIVCLIAPFSKWRSWLADSPELAVFSGLLVIVSLITIIQHLVLGTDFLEARFAVFLVPLFLMVVIHLVLFTADGKGMWFAVPTMLVLCALSIASTRSSAFPLTHGEWYYDVQTDEAIEVIQSRHQSGDQVHIGNSWELEPTINFYRVQLGLNWLDRATRDGTLPKDDYRYLIESSMSPADTVGFREIKRFERAHTILFERIAER